jgi:peptide/nickel transport system permease protein
MGKEPVIIQRSEVGGGHRGTVPGGPATPGTVTGVQLMQGLGVQPAQGFWAEAWASVVKRPRARFALGWLGLVCLLAVFAPFIATGHPIILRELDESGKVVNVSSPLLQNLSAADVLLALFALAGGAWMLLARKLSRGERLAALLVAFVHGACVVIASGAVAALVRDAESTQLREMGRETWFRYAAAGGIAALLGGLFFFLSPLKQASSRAGAAVVVGLVATLVCGTWWIKPPVTFPYRDLEAAGKATAVYTLIPFSPEQRTLTGDLLRPGMSADQTKSDPLDKPPTPGKPRHLLGTDSLGQDVLSQLLHACRLSISIGLVSTGIAVLIGVTMGALMGYFGGWVDLLLYRIVEVFMSVPVLFLLIVAAAVLPRSTYVMMAIIGCVTWTGAARFTRAEFMRLRNQDFVQAAKACGLPLRSILFRHMLPNGVTPVLVDASFAIAAAILAESTLSYLGLGPEEQPSWGRLLSDSTNNVGQFLWWLAIFPGVAIFLSVLAYNLLGESLRDAIDPKLKKARV